MANKPKRLLAAKHPVRIEGSKVQFGKDDGSGKLPTFSMTAYTGAAISQWWSDVPIVVDLETLRVPTGAMAILHDHCTHEKVGHTSMIKNDKKSIFIEGVISCTTDAAKDVAESGKNNFPWQASIGCDNGSIEQHREEGTVTVNGQVHQCPVDVYRNGELYETSFVVFGADNNTSASVKAKKKGGIMPILLERFIAKLTGTKAGRKLVEAAAKAAEEEKDEDDPEASDEEKDDPETSDDDKDDPEASEDDEDDDPEASDDDDDEPKARRGRSGKSPQASYRKAQAAETRRIAAVRKICAGRYSKIEATAIEDGWSPEKTELRVLKAEKIRKERPMPPAIRQGATGNGPNRNDVIAASAMLGLGKDEKFVGSQFSEAVMNEAVAAQNRGYSLNRIVAECIRENANALGVHLPSAEGLRGYGMWQHYVNAQREFGGRVMASGASFSTISLPGILSNVANKTLLGAYAAVPLIFRKLFRKASQSDFKPAFTYRIYLENGRLQKIPSSGKIPATTLDEEQYERGLDTVGDMITITRKMIINDDLNALAKIPEMFGRLAAETIEQDGFDMLKKSRTKLFTAGKNRVKTNKKLDSAGLNEAYNLFRQMTDKKGRPINIEPHYLLTAPALFADAWTLLSSVYVNQSTDKPTGDKNPWANRFEHVDTSFLSSTQGKGETKGSDEEWYMLPKPSDVSLFSISYLDGRENPIIEQEQAAFDVLGVQMRIYHDFGINEEDEKGGVFSPGK